MRGKGLHKITLRKAVYGVIAITQGDRPTAGELQAMLKAGYLTITASGYAAASASVASMNTMAKGA